MSKAQEARDRRYFKAIKAIAEHTVHIALVDAKEQAKEALAEDSAECVTHISEAEYIEDFFNDNFQDYSCDLIAVDLEDAYNTAKEAAGL